MDAPKRTRRVFALTTLFAPKTPFLLSASAAILLSVGCGGASENEMAKESGSGQAGTLAGSQSVEAPPQTPSPGEVVSQFLDRVRRGGNDNSANLLLTKLAQQEMIRIGRPLQFPGSPDTRFKVGRIMPIPSQQHSVYVETFLIDDQPAQQLGGEQDSTYEVVWTLRKQNSDWRISGFVLNQGDEYEPLEINFENGQQMEALLASMEEDGSELR